METSGETQCCYVDTADKYLVVTQKSYGGQTVYPEVGIYVSVNETTGQCHVSYEPEADNSVSEVCFFYLYFTSLSTMITYDVMFSC